MARITVLGGSGYAGGAVVAEAARRGHDVVALSRNAPAAPIEGVRYISGSALEATVLAEATAGSDAIIFALSPRGDMAGKLEGIVSTLLAQLDGTGTRFGYVGGASSLLIAEGGPTLWDETEAQIPADLKPEIVTGLTALDLLRSSPESVDWFYVSPPEEFGAWLSTPSKGSYTLGGDILLRDEAGASTISAADLALAILDEVEQPKHRRARFTAIS